MKEQKFVSVVAYVHNGQDLIEEFLENVMGTCTEQFEKCELILVNDFSTDESLARIHQYFDEHPADYLVSIIKTGIYQGIESSMNAGRDMSIGDYVFEFDDLHVDYDTQLLMQSYRKCLEGNDIVSVRSNARTRLTSRLFYKVFNHSSHGKYMIGQETFRLLSRRAINRVKSIGSYIPYRKAVYMNCGLATASLVYEARDGKHSMTRHSRNDERAEVALDSFIYFTNVMERLSFGIALAFMVIALFMVIFVIWSFFMDQHLESGWVSLMGFLCIGFIGIFGLLTIVLKYLSVLVNLVYRHQHYLIEDVEKISKN